MTEKIRIVRRLDFTKDFRIDATYEEHGAILSAVLARRADEAARLLRAHIGMSRAEVSKITLRMLHEARGRAGPRRRRRAPAGYGARATRGAMSALQLSVDFQRHRCSSSRLTAPDSA